MMTNIVSGYQLQLVTYKPTNVIDRLPPIIVFCSMYKVKHQQVRQMR